MLGLLLTLPLLFGQAPAQPAAGGAAPAAGAAQPAPSPISTLIPLLPIPILFYFLMIRPQQQQERKRKEMIDTMDRHARVVTSGGIHGTVVALNKEEDTVTLRVDDERGVKIVFSRGSIVKVYESGEKKGESAREV